MKIGAQVVETPRFQRMDKLFHKKTSKANCKYSPFSSMYIFKYALIVLAFLYMCEQICRNCCKHSFLHLYICICDDLIAHKPGNISFHFSFHTIWFISIYVLQEDQCRQPEGSGQTLRGTQRVRLPTSARILLKLGVDIIVVVVK